MLREPKSGASRADIVVVSKTEEDISSDEMSKIADQVSRYGIRKTIFSYMRYRDSMEFSSGEKMPIAYLRNCDVIIVAGIAKPQAFISFVKENAKSTAEFLFKDHHQFTSGEIIKIKERYQELVTRNNGPVLVVTTRKDWMRLNSSELKHLHQSLPLAVIDIEVCFHQDGSKVLSELIEASIRQKGF
jgi:tetraacyldisaccharide 4'-kinase